MQASGYKSAKSAVFCMFHFPYLHGKQVQYKRDVSNCQEFFWEKPPIFGLQIKNFLHFRTAQQ